MRLEFDRVGQVAGLLVRAFARDPLWVAVFPAASRRARGTRALFGYMTRYGALRGEVQVDADPARGAAVWLPGTEHGADLLTGLRCGALGLPFAVGWAGLGKLAAAMDTVAAMRARHCPRPYRYLAVLGVDPDHQRCGVGSGLVRPMLERSDAEGLDVWLETETEGNVGFYERLGFDVKDEAVLPRLDVRLWGMLCSATDASGLPRSHSIV
jgi:ribosomal protein S18 acetylase RimI-like enzyme